MHYSPFMTFRAGGGLSSPMRRDHMKRRQFVEQLGIGSAVLAAASVAHAAQGGEHDHKALTGPLASATVSFGAWPVGTAEVPRDRFTSPFAPMGPNVHALLPQEVTIKEGGSVNFIVAGFHHIVVYAPGKDPDEINQAVLLPVPNAPVTVGLIDDPQGRIYRGLDPRLANTFQDRVEVVGFSTRGTYLVICAVNVHFNMGMFGWVKVIA
jgi:plastocyanin